jgi:hypothetical protein
MMIMAPKGIEMKISPYVRIVVHRPGVVLLAEEIRAHILWGR